MRTITRRNVQRFLDSALCDAYLTMQTRCERHVPPKEHIAASLSDGLGCYVLLVAAGGRRVMAGCFLLGSAWNTWQMEEVCVAPEERGKGLCGSLARESLALARRRGVRRLSVYCLNNNAAACACYRRAFGPPVHVDKAGGSVAFEADINSCRGAKLTHAPERRI